MTTDFVTAFLAMTVLVALQAHRNDTQDFVTAFLAMTVLVALQAHRNDGGFRHCVPRNDTLDLVIARSFATKQSTN